MEGLNVIFLAAGLILVNVILPCNAEQSSGASLNLSLKSSFDPSDSIYDVFVKQDYLYLLSSVEGLFIIDISNISHPTIEGQYATTLGGPPEIVVGEGYGYVAAYGLNVFDVSTPSNPQLITEAGCCSYATSLSIREDMVYATGSSVGEFNVVDVSQPESPTITKSISIFAKNHVFAQSDQYLAIAGRPDIYNTGGGAFLYNVSNPENPQLLSAYEGIAEVSKNAIGVDVSSSWLTVIDNQEGESSLYITKPGLVNSDQTEKVIKINLSSENYTKNYAIDVEIANDYAYVLQSCGKSFYDYTSCLSVYDLAGFSENNTERVKKIEVGESTQDIEIVSNYVFIAHLEEGVRIYQISTTDAGVIPGDINGDGEVNLIDLGLLGQAWGSSEGDENWNSAADLNSDGSINLTDLGILGQNWSSG